MVRFKVLLDTFGLHIFIHNRGQMYFPKMDKIFGSNFMALQVDSARVKKGMAEGKIFHIMSTYKMEKTHWKALDTNTKRCISDNYKEANTTKCITEFLENKVACSVGLPGSNSKIKRYHHSL